MAAPLAHRVVRDVLGWGALLYGGNFAARRAALEAIGGFDTSIEFHGEDTNVGRRLHRVGRVALSRRCVMFTSARRYTAMGTTAVMRLYARNFWHEVLFHRPADQPARRREDLIRIPRPDVSAGRGRGCR